MDQVAISVVIPTYNRKDLLKKSLETLMRQTLPPEKFEVIVVDDGSTDSTESLVKGFQERYVNIRYLKQSHGGTIRARNLGMKKGQGLIIALTDDDCLAQSDWLEQINKAFENHPQALGIEGKTKTHETEVNPFTTQIVNLEGGTYQTCNIAYKREILEKVGWLDENFPALACDDIDLALRILEFGPIYFAADAIVTHLPRQTSFKKEFNRVKSIESEFYLFLKHPDHFKEKYGYRHIFLQVVFVNSIWMRLFYLKHYAQWISKNPALYLKYLTRILLEIGFIFLLIPNFWLSFNKIRNSMINTI